MRTVCFRIICADLEVQPPLLVDTYLFLQSKMFRKNTGNDYVWRMIIVREEELWREREGRSLICMTRGAELLDAALGKRYRKVE